MLFKSQPESMQLGRAWACICALALAARLLTADATQVRVRRGGYEGVVVAISPEVSESAALVDAIKNKVRAASHLLFNATRNTVFFRHVTILLPKTWRGVEPDSHGGGTSYEESAIRVAPASPAYGHQPYTLQPGECGSPGKFSHFTPDILTDEGLSDVWGPPEKLMVLEWAKLRWGVFDEVGYRDDEQFPLYYRPDFEGEDYDDEEGENSVKEENRGIGKEEPEFEETLTTDDSLDGVRVERKALEERKARLTANLCAAGNLEGRYVNPQTGEECIRQEEKCDFLVKDFRANLWPVSLDEEWRRKADVAFCDDEEHSAFRHNKQSPNKHNLRCNEESWWTVMRRHPDFKETQSDPEETQFTVAQPVDARVVMLLELIPRTAHDALALARRWLDEGAEAGSYVGVLLLLSGFKNAEKVAEMTRLSLSSRLSITEALERRADAAMSETRSGPPAKVRKGLQEASKMLPDITHGNALVLMICSSPVEKKDLRDIENGWTTPIYTISLGNESSDLREFVEQTKGRFISFDDALDEDKQRDLVFDVANYVSQPREPPSEAPIFLQNETIWGKTEGSSVQLDGTPGTLVFRLTTNNPDHVMEPPSVRPQHPPGEAYQARPRAGSSLNQWTVVVDDASTRKPGAWVWQVNTTDDANSFVRLETLLEPEADEGPGIHVDSWIAPISGPDGDAGTSDGVVLFARVTKGEVPVLGAEVVAHVTSAENSSVKQQLALLDSGSGVDSQAEDGVYSRFLPPFAVGSFSVDVRVTNNDTKIPQADIKERSRYSRPKMCCGSTFPSSTKTLPVRHLNRISHAGTVTITNYPKEDRTSPSRVTDLRVKEVALSGLYYARVRLAWTATGDDRDFGRASTYSVRASPRRGPEKAETCADACMELEPSFEAGAASPSAGERVTASVLLPSHGHIHFFLAVTAQDDVGNASPPSNVVAVEMRGGLLLQFQPWARLLLWLMIGLVATLALALPLLLACDRHQCRFLWRDNSFLLGKCEPLGGSQAYNIPINATEL